MEAFRYKCDLHQYRPFICKYSEVSSFAIPLHRLLSRTGQREQNTNYMNTVPVETKGVWISAIDNVLY